MNIKTEDKIFQQMQLYIYPRVNIKRSGNKPANSESNQSATRFVQKPRIYKTISRETKLNVYKTICRLRHGCEPWLFSPIIHVILLWKSVQI